MRTGRLKSVAALAGCVLLALACARRPIVPTVPAAAPPEPPVSPPVQAAPTPQAGPAPVPCAWSEVGEPADDLGWSGVAEACRQSLIYFGRLPASAVLKLGSWDVPAAIVADSVRELLRIAEDGGLDASGKSARIKEIFLPYRVACSEGNGELLVTGYYEPVLPGRLRSDDQFRYPIYSRPPDLVTADLSQFPLAESQAKIVGRLVGDRLVPYFSREDIDGGGALRGKGLEIAYLADPVEVFFLQVQGSGRLQLEDGRTVRVQYDGKNGHPYASLGRHLIEAGLLAEDQASMQDIRDLLASMGESERQAKLNVNPSYTFFRFETGGPYGSLNIPLTPSRSVALDPAVFPKGAPALLLSRKPDLGAGGALRGWTPFSRIVLSQDAGGAIRGPGRVDLFCGAGAPAEAVAGRLREPGRLYFLLKRKV
ncbi:MAG: murein transglycosylase A [Acidobacteriota bacterium]